MRVPEICGSCRDRPCAARDVPTSPIATTAGSLAIGTCGRGIDFAVVRLGGERITLNGLMIPTVGKDRSRRVKKLLAGNAVELARLRNWVESQSKALAQRDADVEERTRQALEMFHDVQTAASSIIRSAERLQASQTGRTDDEKFAALHPAAQTLVKAARLLELRLRTMPIVTNPSAAAYGRRYTKLLVSIVYSLVKTLEPVAQARRIAVKLLGESRKRVDVYESFDLLPLILIENAVKYSSENQSVEVHVNDTDTGVAISVESFSPWIPPDERARIFERRFRASTSTAVANAGSGLGLYIAESVARAHSTHILHGTDDGNAVVNGIRYCNNKFSFSVR